MNNRTNLHIDYYDANKNRLKRFEKLQKAKIKVPLDQNEVELAETEHKKVGFDICKKHEPAYISTGNRHAKIARN